MGLLEIHHSPSNGTPPPGGTCVKTPMNRDFNWLFFYSGVRPFMRILKNRQISRCEKPPFLPVSETAVVRLFMHISKTAGNCSFFKRVVADTQHPGAEVLRYQDASSYPLEINTSLLTVIFLCIPFNLQNIS